MKTPLHDYSSDTSDAFRYMAIMANKDYLPAPTPHESITNSLARGREYSMNQLFNERENSMNRNNFKSRRI